ncbi:MAG: serine--tRNA ligase [Peptococcaceae bacterium]|jgi:seryl-tRNA synthetase|nr:serine--tRNA ligase [Peptococcaceae bacterium]MDR2736118.1 serine--tRNA ligase [Gracilibacteraceae bacterium]
MLDLKNIRANPDFLKQALENRQAKVDLERFLTYDAEYRKMLFEVENLKARRNKASEDIALLKRQGEPAEPLITEMRELGDIIKKGEQTLSQIEDLMGAVLYEIPNIPHTSVPVGADEKDNVMVRSWGTPPAFPFIPQAHFDLGEKLGILDFQRGAKVTGARFTFYRGLGARLERALISFMLDRHIERGYTEIMPPYIVNRAAMTGTGNLPKFEEDAFKLENSEYFLIPTAEVPVTNLYREEILNAAELPIRHCAFSACFRAEAGAAGRDTRGLIRQHQFNKVELVHFAAPEKSYQELEALTAAAESILQDLELPYRVMLLCTGDMGFASAKTYDLEVWLPSFNTYREISSCSNCEDFQARRANIRFRRDPKAKPEFMHTLNGSGLAIGRSVAAVLENYQQEDGSVVVPQVLRRYMGCDVIN